MQQLSQPLRAQEMKETQARNGRRLKQRYANVEGQLLETSKNRMAINDNKGQVVWPIIFFMIR